MKDQLKSGSYQQQWADELDGLIGPLRSPRVERAFSETNVGGTPTKSVDAPLANFQPYPGASLPILSDRTLFPIPDRVGVYGSYDEFSKYPKYMAQWVHWPKRTELILEGRYHELPPVHFEGIFTLVCNLLCPHCSRRVTRTKWNSDDTWTINRMVNPMNTMYPVDLRRVLDEVSTLNMDGQMGIVWGGGDPTASPFTYDGMLYATSLGITSSLLTNGIFLDVPRALDADPVLVRISLNCGSEAHYRRFHGYPKGWDYFDRARANLRELSRQKQYRGSRTLVGVSLIVDERNLSDMVAAAREIRSVVDDTGPGIDYVIVRPVFDYAHFETKRARLQSDTKIRARELICEGGEVWQILNESGVALVPIKDSFESPPAPEDYTDTRCLAYGLCGEIRHNGDLQLCSDSYGNPEYTIGNVLQQSLKDIWCSERRLEVLQRINDRQCYKVTCPYNSRGHHHNRVFHQIEKLRHQGQMDVVRQWIHDLRATTYPLGHSFFI